MRRLVILLAAMFIVPIGSATAYWQPPPRTTWQWQLSGIIDQSVPAQVYDVDAFDTPASAVASLKASGRRVVCYFSAGSYEDWRPDASAFPAAVLGSNNGWPGERWLDIRRLDVLGPIMTSRMAICRDKGFDAVEPDNVDGYTNATGFPLTAADQITYNRLIATTAHGLGLSVGLKNDIDQVSALEASFDFAVNEECFAYDECAPLSQFIAAGKAVFNAEYSGESAAFCPTANALGFSTLKKQLALGPWYESCLPLNAPPIVEPAPDTTPPAAPPAVTPPVEASPVTSPSAAAPSAAVPLAPATLVPAKPHRTITRTYTCLGKIARLTIAGKRYVFSCGRYGRVKRIVVKGPKMIVTYVLSRVRKR